MKAVIVLVMAGMGCTYAAGGLRSEQEYGERQLLRNSLMKPENALISEEGIQRLLASRIEIPKRAKLAVHAFSHRSVELGGWTRPEILEARKDALSTLEGPLGATGRFSEITHVP
ncbi:MAG TPA: hypothetical protein VJB14_04870, partial [Planctomycetota bacterium]|nr:hypothetical protein [Planctomycetota bacterium]